MKTTLVLISLSSLYLINAETVRRTRPPTTSTTDAGFIAKYFHIPEFWKFSRNEKTTEPPVKTLELQQKSRLSRILDAVNIFKKEKPFGEPYLRAYVQPDGSYKWYFVYPGQMLYPAPDDFSVDLERTIPPTTPTTTTTTTERSTDSDDEYKPLYPLGKIEFVKNETEPKENKGAITISDDGPIFQPYAKIKPPFDEPLLQSQLNVEDNQESEEDPEPVEQNASVAENSKKHTKTSSPEEPQAQDDESTEDDQPADEQAQEENQAAYDNYEPEENSPDDENTADDDNEPQDEGEKTLEDNPPPADERTPATKGKSKKRKRSG